MIDAAARLQEAVRCVEAGRLANADTICAEILEQVPGSHPALFLRGLVAFQQGDPGRSIGLLRDAAAFDPDNASYHATLGAVLVDHGNGEEAVAVLTKAASLNPDDAESLRHLARKLDNLGRVNHAIAVWERLAAAVKPDVADILALGVLLQRERGTDAALPQFETAVALAPENVLAHNHLAACQQLCGAIVETIAAYRRSLDLQSEDNPASIGLFAAMQTACDWDGFDTMRGHVDRMTGAALAAGASPVEDPFLNVSHSMDTARNFAVAQAWSGDIARRVAAWGVRFDHAPRARNVLRIGYLSSDFHDHATAHLMLGLFGAHDRSAVSVHAYACSPDDGSEYRRRIVEDCDGFVDLTGVPTLDAARRIHADDIDILIDLKGYTRQHRLDIAALRPAPVQVAWLGFPGTSGAEFFDYIVTDDIVTPPEVQSAYSEAFAAMPHCYQVNNRDQAIAEPPITRAEARLPEDAVVLASFNNTYKLEPVMFAAWMDLLRDLPNAVLWLLPNNPLAVDNLRRAASDAGLLPERLIFADMVPKAEHLRRAGLADLALDTRIYNGHTTTSDMLWAGVPVVTLQGDHFASRVSASLLTAFGLPELITQSMRDYKMLVRDLVRSPERLAVLRDRTAQLRLRSPLFDTDRFARDLERAYAEMWRRYENGEAPERLAVSELT